MKESRPLQGAGFEAQSKFANVRATTLAGGAVGGFDGIKIVP